MGGQEALLLWSLVNRVGREAGPEREGTLDGLAPEMKCSGLKATLSFLLTTHWPGSVPGPHTFTCPPPTHPPSPESAIQPRAQKVESWKGLANCTNV